MRDLLHRVAELCLELERADSRGAVRSILQDATRCLDAKFFLFGMRPGKYSPPGVCVISNYPDRWRRRYDEMRAIEFDPVVCTAYQAQGAFRWDGLHKDARQLQLRQESIRNGMEFGMSCADRGMNGSVAILSFCGDKPIAPEAQQWEATRAALTLLAGATHTAVTRIETSGATSAPELLTESERQCLELTASGKTAKEVARVLGVRPRTVKYYLDRAVDKLRVDSREEAVIRAMTSGIIDPLRFLDRPFGNSSELGQ